MAKDGNHLFVRRAAIKQQIARSYVTAQLGVAGQTHGIRKMAEERARKALNIDGVGGVESGPLSAFRTHSRLGVNRKEYLAVLSADMRGSTALAEKHGADSIFTLVQCFVPLLAFIVHELDGEVVGLRGDGLIAAFGFEDKKWYPCVNHAYEAGMAMIQAVQEELIPFLSSQSVPTPKGMGVGVDCGQVTITKIGLGDAVEVTAYGSAVNQAAKKSKLENGVWLSPKANTFLHSEESYGTFYQKRNRLT